MRGITKYSLLAWFMLTPFFWRLDLSRMVLGFYDVFFINPYSVVHATIFYLLILFSLYFERKTSLFSIFLIALYYPFIILSNYPCLTHRDVFLHGAPTKSILANGIINYPREPVAEYWPSSFILWGLTAVVLGVDLITANYILYFCLVLVLALIMYSFAKVLWNEGYRLVTVSATLFLGIFVPNHSFEFNHYARQTYAFILLFLFLFSFLRYRSRRNTLISLVTVALLATTHPHQTLYVTMFLLAYTSLSHTYCNFLNKNKVTLFSAVAFLSWWIFQGTPSLEIAYSWMKGAFSPENWYPFIHVMSPAEPLPLWGVVFKNYFKISFLLLLALAFSASILLLRDSKKQRYNLSPTIISLISVSLISLPFMLILSFMRPWSITRFTAFAAFPIAFSSIVCLNELLKKKRKKILNRVKTIEIFLLVFIISLSFTTLMLKFERNTSVVEAAHTSEFSCLAFLYNASYHPSVITTTFRTSLYYYYYDYSCQDQILSLASEEIAEANLTTFWSHAIEHIEQSSFVLRGMRDEWDLYQRSHFHLNLEKSFEAYNRLDKELIIPRFNIVYSNGYYTTYRKG